MVFDTVHTNLQGFCKDLVCRLTVSVKQSEYVPEHGHWEVNSQATKFVLIAIL